MNKIDDLMQYHHNSVPMACIDGKWVVARPENNKREFTSFRYRIKEAWNVFIGKAETLYYYKQ